MLSAERFGCWKEEGLCCTVITGLHSLMIRFQHAFLYRVQSAWAAFTTLSWKTVHLHIREIICIVPVC